MIHRVPNILEIESMTSSSPSCTLSFRFRREVLGSSTKNVKRSSADFNNDPRLDSCSPGKNMEQGQLERGEDIPLKRCQRSFADFNDGTRPRLLYMVTKIREFGNEILWYVFLEGIARWYSFGL